MAEILLKDPVLRPLVKKIELPPLAAGETVYFSLTRAIVSQQLSTKAAQTIFDRFLDLFPDRQPRPEQVIGIEFEALRSAGLSGQKAGYIKNIAARARDDDWSGINWQDISDEEILDYLTQIKGVGVWTTQMLLMFTLDRPDIFPAGDLGIQQSMKRLYRKELEGKALLKWMEEVASVWRPHRTLACRYLWQWKDQ